MYDTLGELISRRLVDLDLSKADLARCTSLSAAYIGNLANDEATTSRGGTHSPSLKTIEKLAKCLQVSKMEILIALGYLPKKQVVNPRPERAAQYVASLPDDKQDDALLYLKMLSQQYANSGTHSNQVMHHRSNKVNHTGKVRNDDEIVHPPHEAKKDTIKSNKAKKKRA